MSILGTCVDGIVFGGQFAVPQGIEALGGRQKGVFDCGRDLVVTCSRVVFNLRP